MENNPFSHHVAEKAIPQRQAFCNLLGRSHQQIDREREVNCLTNLNRLLHVAQRRIQGNQQIDIAIRRGRTMGERTEQPNLVGVKTVDNLVHNVLDI